MEIVKKISLKVREYFSKGHERSIKAKKNILLLFLTKGFSVIITLLLVPLVLHYLDSVKYGIWLTLSSVISWIYFFDIGLGNGLRNKFAEAKANEDIVLAKSYVSTTYAILSLIIIIVYFLFIIINFSLDWTKILNAPDYLKEELNLLVIITFSFFSIGFITKLLDTILIADQRPGTSSIVALIGNFLSLVLIYFLTKFTSSSLLLAGTALSISSISISILATIYFFSKDYKDFRPSLKSIDWKHAPELMGLGVKFFIIQIAVLVIFTASNIIIAQLFGPSQVTVYNIAYKYFSIVIMVFGIIITPFWSAYTEAYTKNDFDWIKSITKKLLNIWYVFAIIVVVMIAFSNNVYRFWVGKEINIPIGLSIFMGIYVLLINLSNIFTTLINGTGKIKVQLYLSIVMGILSLPIIIFLTKILNLGVTGIIIGTCISLVPFLIILPIQYSKILSQKSYGIWNE